MPFTKVATIPVLDVQALIRCRLALRWTADYQHRINGTHGQHSNMMISRVIYECTGQRRSRKQVSSHIQALRKMITEMPEDWDNLIQQVDRATTELREAETEDTAQITRIIRRGQNALFILATRNLENEYAAFHRSHPRQRQRRRKTQASPKSRIRPAKFMPDGPAHSLFHEISRFAPQNGRELSFEPLRPLGANFLALSSVDHFFRTEVLQYIEDHLSFDFTDNEIALQSFCTHIEPIRRQHLKQIAVEFVDSHAADVPSPSTTFGTYLSTNLPNLKTVSLTLIPRNPTRADIFDTQHHWGQPTEDFMSSLDDLKATVVLKLQWKEDCDYFEENYVGIRGWKCIQRSEDPGEHEQPPVWYVYA